jgi:hypothetical protein
VWTTAGKHVVQWVCGRFHEEDSKAWVSAKQSLDEVLIPTPHIIPSFE